MSETMLYILFALRHEMYGYAIMQYVRELTHGRVELGAGTMYSTLVKLERAQLIRATTPQDRQKPYIITEKGLETLKAEARRIEEIYLNIKDVL